MESGTRQVARRGVTRVVVAVEVVVATEIIVEFATEIVVILVVGVVVVSKGSSYNRDR